MPPFNFNIKRIFNAVSSRFSGESAKSFLGSLHRSLPLSPRNWGKTSFLEASENSLYVNKAIDKRAEKVSEIEFELRDARGNLIEEHEILDLLRKPNSVMQPQDFWKLYQKYKDITGEAYLFIERGEKEVTGTGRPASKIIGLHLLRPEFVTPKFNQFGRVETFKYQTAELDVDYGPEDIIYIYNPDPRNPLRGQSLLKAGINAIQTELQISTYHSRIIENGGKVEGIFTINNERITEDQLVDMKEKYQKQYGHSKKSGMPMFLSGNVDYKNIGLTPTELSFLDAKKMTLEDISMLTGVPKTLLGSYDDVQYSNADTSVRVFLRETIRPLLRALTTALNESLVPEELTLEFVDPTPENVEERLKETESGIKNYYMTVNEARERHGLDPVPEGERILKPINVAPLGTGDGGTNTNTYKRSTATKQEEKSAHKEYHPLRDSDVRELYGKVQEKRIDNRAKHVEDIVRQYFNEQSARLIEAIQPENKHVFRKKDLLGEVFNEEQELSLGKELFVPALTQILVESGQDVAELVGSQFEFNAGPDTVSFIDKRSDTFLRQINGTTFTKLKEQFEESFAASETRQQLVERIQNTYGEQKESRAATIARTEAHAASQFGSFEGYKQAGISTKIWVWGPGVLGGVRDDHQAMDGEEVPVDAAFSNGLMHPGDPNGSASETINCQCVI